MELTKFATSPASLPLPILLWIFFNKKPYRRILEKISTTYIMPYWQSPWEEKDTSSDLVTTQEDERKVKERSIRGHLSQIIPPSIHQSNQTSIPSMEMTRTYGDARACVLTAYHFPCFLPSHYSAHQL